jgi:iron complex transport system ATP-binding protein
MSVPLINSEISLDRISIGYHRERPLLAEISLVAESGELIALVGRNGSGKSTMLRSILGLIPMLEGTCLLRGVPVQEYDPRRRALTVSYVSSQVARLPSITVRELVSLGRIPHTGWMGSLDQNDRLKVEAAIREVGMENYTDQGLDQLSDGERQRVMIARALVQDTPIMILDEPAAYLDIPNKYELIRILSEFRDRGKTIIYSTHDLENAMLCADKFWVIHRAQVFDGSPEDLGLSGLFDQLFESSGITFDKGSARFKSPVAPRGTIGLKGDHPQLLIWTRFALERLGFEVTDLDKFTMIEVTAINGEYRWKVKRGNMEHLFENLYRMARFLTKDE